MGLDLSNGLYGHWMDPGVGAEHGELASPGGLGERQSLGDGRRARFRPFTVLIPSRRSIRLDQPCTDGWNEPPPLLKLVVELDAI